LEVNVGEVFGFLGPNGAGKTTAINVLLGFVPPTRGAAYLFGIDVRQPIARQRIGYLPEMTYYYKFLTAEELLRFYARIFGLPERKRTSALTSCSSSLNWSRRANVPSNPIPRACSSASASRRRSSTIPIC
jgi:ABC-2 type transport system ATP-binding protein